MSLIKVRARWKTLEGVPAQILGVVQRARRCLRVEMRQLALLSGALLQLQALQPPVSWRQ